MTLDKDLIQVCLPDQTQFESERLEHLGSERSRREQGHQSCISLLELLLTLILEPSGRKIAQKTHFGLAGFLFPMLALRPFPNCFLLIHYLLFNVAELFNAFRIPRSIYKVKVGAVVKGLEYARGRCVGEATCFAH